MRMFRGSFVIIVLLAMPMRATSGAEHGATGPRGSEAPVHDERDLAGPERWLSLPMRDVWKAADGGDVGAMLALGRMLQFGLGTIAPGAKERNPPDLKEAQVWYRRASENGSAQGALFLAQAIESTVAHAKDGKDAMPARVEALKWYRLAAERGDLKAMLRVATAMRAGTDTKRDVPGAIRWLESAATKGDNEAARLLSYLYGVGDGIPRSRGLAEKWEELARAGYHASVGVSPETSALWLWEDSGVRWGSLATDNVWFSIAYDLLRAGKDIGDNIRDLEEALKTTPEYRRRPVGAINGGALDDLRRKLEDIRRRVEAELSDPARAQRRRELPKVKPQWAKSEGRRMVAAIIAPASDNCVSITFRAMLAPEWVTKPPSSGREPDWERFKDQAKRADRAPWPLYGLLEDEPADSLPMAGHQAGFVVDGAYCNRLLKGTTADNGVYLACPKEASAEELEKVGKFNAGDLQVFLSYKERKPWEELVGAAHIGVEDPGHTYINNCPSNGRLQRGSHMEERPPLIAAVLPLPGFVRQRIAAVIESRQLLGAAQNANSRDLDARRAKFIETWWPMPMAKQVLAAWDEDRARLARNAAASRARVIAALRTDVTADDPRSLAQHWNIVKGFAPTELKQGIDAAQSAMTQTLAQGMARVRHDALWHAEAYLSVTEEWAGRFTLSAEQQATLAALRAGVAELREKHRQTAEARARKAARCGEVFSELLRSGRKRTDVEQRWFEARNRYLAACSLDRVYQFVSAAPLIAVVKREECEREAHGAFVAACVGDQ